MSDLRKIIIDGGEIEVDPRMTLLQACEVAGVEVPRFCYHERLSIAGNCRMCLVEVVGGPPKPAASCAMQVKDLRPGPEGAPPEVKTKSPMVKKAREGVMEFLLINHPLDCPICDQGGECDLQDQAMAYGVDFSRYREPKRAAVDMDLGPLVGTCMTRCISCTRCVRFITEVAGVPEMGQTGRGEDSEITSYLGAMLTSEMQGNVIDLCPVGALTSKPYAFTARPWELTKTESIDVMDALGSNIRIDTKGREVMRILPRNNDGVNEEWLADRSRFIWDGLRRQRLDKPYVRRDGKLQAATWNQAFDAIAEAVKDKTIAGVVGDLVSTESAFALKQLIERLDGPIECRTDGAKLPAGNRSAYVGTARIEDIDAAQAIMLIGTNPRKEAPVLNARIRKAWLNGAKVGLVGENVDLTYPYYHAGTGREALAKMLEEGHDDAVGRETVVIVGQDALRGDDGGAVLAAAMRFASNTESRFLVLHTAAGRVGAMDLGCVTEGGMTAALDGAGVIYNLGCDEVDMPDGAFVIYQGSHGDRGAHRADVVLPGAAYTEESGIFVNTEGRPQMAMRAGFPPGDARENWTILRALSARLGATLPFDAIGMLRSAMFASTPHLAQIDTVPENAWTPLEGGDMTQADFGSAVRDHFLANPVMRASTVMAELAKLAEEREQPMAAEQGMESGFFDTGFGIFVLILSQCLLVTVLILVSLAFLMYADRKIWAAVQMRRGPNVVGPWGLLQSFADFLKYIVKEIVVPAGADKTVFFMAPMITFVLSMIVWAVMPWNEGWVISDLNVGILFIFAISSLEVYGVIMGGWASNSKYPFLGSLRSAAQMISYEVSIGLIIIGVLVSTGSLNLSDIVRAQDGGMGAFSWYWLPHLPMVFLFFISALAETNRPPFDLPEAESELVAGYQVEYSSTPFLLFMIGELMAVVFMCALMSILFFGGWLSPIPFLPDGLHWMVLKMGFFFFIFALVKAVVPRYRYDQLMRIGWKFFLPMSLAWVALVGLFAQYGWFWGAYQRWTVGG